MHKVSCLIPAYNEGTRIASILSVVCNHPLINEVIVINDCSTDNTSKVVMEYKNIHLINNKENKGKSATIVAGIKEATGDILCLIDADLIGLTTENITNLIEPVISDKTDVSISVRRISPIMDKIYQIIGMDFISGERVFKKSLIQNHLEEIACLPRFSLETFLNKIFIKNKTRIKIVFWDNVRSPLKSKKFGFIEGTKREISMFSNILKTASIFEILNQLKNMRRLIIRQ
ncbi:MAG: glycosyltransferase family 2 protein [Candidatus Magasanikiibacteriota bacterium]